jgi:hypothetical protein
MGQAMPCVRTVNKEAARRAWPRRRLGRAVPNGLERPPVRSAGTKGCKERNEQKIIIVRRDIGIR